MIRSDDGIVRYATFRKAIIVILHRSLEPFVRIYQQLTIDDA